MVIIGHF